MPVKNKGKRLVPRLDNSNGKRKRVNWPLMFEMWCDTDMTVAGFLNQFADCNPYSGNSKRMTKEWSDVKRMAYREKQRMETGRTQDKLTQGLGLWDTIKSWRKEQARSDYNTADAVRVHLKLILNQSIRKDPDTDKAISLLKASEAKAITEALVNIQKIQRLSLGMSTENVGVEMPDSHVEKPSDEDMDYPMFIVEVNDNGKFKSPRPKQVN